MANYIDRMQVYLDATDTDTWVAWGVASDLDNPELSMVESTFSPINGGRTLHMASGNYDFSSIKFTLSYDPAITTSLYTNAMAGTTQHFKFEGANGRCFEGHCFVLKLKPVSVKGDKGEFAQLSVELQDTGDLVETAGTAAPTNWYDRIVSLNLGSDFTVAVAGTKLITVRGVYDDGHSVAIDPGLLTFATSDNTKVTFVAGLATGAAGGSSYLSASITAAPTKTGTVKATCA